MHKPCFSGFTLSHYTAILASLHWERVFNPVVGLDVEYFVLTDVIGPVQPLLKLSGILNITSYFATNLCKLIVNHICIYICFINVHLLPTACLCYSQVLTVTYQSLSISKQMTSPNSTDWSIPHPDCWF